MFKPDLIEVPLFAKTQAAPLQHGHQGVGDIGPEALAVGGPVEQGRGRHPAGAQDGRDGGRLPMMGWTPPDGIDVPEWWC